MSFCWVFSARPFTTLPLAARTLTVFGSRAAGSVDVGLAGAGADVGGTVVGAADCVVVNVGLRSVDWSSRMPRPRAMTRSTTPRAVLPAADRPNDPSDAACIPRLTGPACRLPSDPRNEPAGAGPASDAAGAPPAGRTPAHRTTRAALAALGNS